MAPMATGEPAAHERLIDINLNGVWRTFRAALPYVRQRRGYLLAISSMAAFVHSPLQASYTASKAGVWAMCDSIRLELRHLGVGVGSAHPTFFRTPMMDDVLADPAGRELWGGNEKGLWRMVPLHTVTTDILSGIERRADLIAIPKTNAPITKAPGVFRRSSTDSGLGQTVARAIELASPAGRPTPLGASHNRPDGAISAIERGGETGRKVKTPFSARHGHPGQTWILSSGTRSRRPGGTGRRALRRDIPIVSAAGQRRRSLLAQGDRADRHP